MTGKKTVIDPLAPEIAQLLAADRAVAPLTSEVETRIQQRIVETLKLPLAIPGTGDGLSNAASAAPTGMLAGPLAQTGETIVKSAALKIAAVFLAGIATGVTGHTAYERLVNDRDVTNQSAAVKKQQAPPDHVNRDGMSASSHPDDTSTSMPETDVSVESPKTVIETANRNIRKKNTDPPTVITEKAVEPKVEREKTRALNAEQKLIEMAQSALARGRPQDALRALKRHRTTFPQGELDEEREALTVLSLIKLGKREEAEMLFSWFRKRYPQSMFNHTINEALK